MNYFGAYSCKSWKGILIVLLVLLFSLPACEKSQPQQEKTSPVHETGRISQNRTQQDTPEQGREQTILTAEEYLLCTEALSYAVTDPSAPNGTAIALVIDGRQTLKGLRWHVDYSRCRLDTVHSLYAVIKTRYGNPPGKKTKPVKLSASVWSPTEKQTAENSLTLTPSPENNAWQAVKLLDFILSRDISLRISLENPGALQELYVDRLYLVSNYPPADETARKNELKPAYTPDQYRTFTENFSISIIYRMKNFFGEEPAQVLERQLYDIRLHHIDTVIVSGIPASHESPEEAAAIIKNILELAEQFDLKIIVPLTAFFPENMLNKFGKEQPPDDKVLKEAGQIIEKYVPLFSSYKATAGYILVDEPFPHQLYLLVAIQKLIEKEAPGHFFITSAQAPHQVNAFADSQNIMLSGCFPFVGNRDLDNSYVLGTKMLAGNIKGKIFGGYYILSVQGFTRGIENRVNRQEYRLQANLELAGGVDGLLHYAYFPHRYNITENQSENYCFVNSVESAYKDEFDLWTEADELGETLAGMKTFLRKLRDTAGPDAVMECEDIRLNCAPRKALDLTVKKLPGIGEFMFVCNISAENAHSGTLLIYPEALKNKKVYDLKKLCEAVHDNGIEVTLRPGDMAVYLVAEPARYYELLEEILNNRLREKAVISALKLRPFSGINETFAELAGEAGQIRNAYADNRRFSGETLAKYYNTLEQAEKKFNEALKNNGEIQEFTGKFAETESILCEIDEFVRANKKITEAVTAKKAVKRDVPVKKEWEILSPVVEEADRQFNKLAGEFLSLKTDYVTGKWRENGNRLAKLQEQASTLRDFTRKH